MPGQPAAARLRDPGERVVVEHGDEGVPVPGEPEVSRDLVEVGTRRSRAGVEEGIGHIELLAEVDGRFPPRVERVPGLGASGLVVKSPIRGGEGGGEAAAFQGRPGFGFQGFPEAFQRGDPGGELGRGWWDPRNRAGAECGFSAEAFRTDPGPLGGGGAVASWAQVAPHPGERATGLQSPWHTEVRGEVKCGPGPFQADARRAQVAGGELAGERDTAKHHAPQSGAERLAFPQVRDAPRR